MSAIISLSIDLTKIDKTKLKDGKYLNTQIFINDDTKYGNNVSMAYSQTKEERDAKQPKQYIANGKVNWTDGTIKVAEKDEPKIEVVKTDDLPF